MRSAAGKPHSSVSGYYVRHRKGRYWREENEGPFSKNLPKPLESDLRIWVEDQGIPKWWEEAAYPKAHDLSLPEWAWEFCRRGTYAFYWRYDAENRLAHATRYGLVAPLDPTTMIKDPKFLAQPVNVAVHLGAGAVNLELSKNQVAIVLDFTLPIIAQIEAAREKIPKVKQPRNRQELYPTYLRLLDARGTNFSFQEISQTLYPRLDSYLAAQRATNQLRAARSLMNGG